MLLLALKRLLKLSLLFLSVFCTLFLVSCNQNSAKPINEDLGSKNERKKSKITFWNGFTGPDGQTMWEIIKNFEADYPEYEVEMEIIHRQKLQDQLEVNTPRATTYVKWKYASRLRLHRTENTHMPH